NQITGSSIRISRRVTAEVDILIYDFRKRIHGRMKIDFRLRAYRSRGTGHDRHTGAAKLRLAGRLVVHHGIITLVAEHAGCNLPAKVAIDTGVVHEELAVDVFRISSRWIRHRESYELYFTTGCSSSAEGFTGAGSLRCVTSSIMSRITSSRWSVLSC